MGLVLYPRPLETIVAAVIPLNLMLNGYLLLAGGTKIRSSGNSFIRRFWNRNRECLYNLEVIYVWSRLYALYRLLQDGGGAISGV